MNSSFPWTYRHYTHPPPPAVDDVDDNKDSYFEIIINSSLMAPAIHEVSDRDGCQSYPGIHDRGSARAPLQELPAFIPAGSD